MNVLCLCSKALLHIETLNLVIIIKNYPASFMRDHIIKVDNWGAILDTINIGERRIHPVFACIGDGEVPANKRSDASGLELIKTQIFFTYCI